MKNGLRFTVYCLLLLTLVGCKATKVIEQVPVYIHDTTATVKEVHDSTFIDRWHTIYQKGDTVFVTNEQITVKLRTVTDTAYKYVEMPVEVVKEQIKEVKKPLAWWQKGLMWCGGIALMLLSGCIVLKIYRK